MHGTNLPLNSMCSFRNIPLDKATVADMVLFAERKLCTIPLLDKNFDASLKSVKHILVFLVFFSNEKGIKAWSYQRHATQSCNDICQKIMLI